MWQRIGHFVLKNRIPLLISLLLITVAMAFFASQVKLSYEFSRAIPDNHPKLAEYKEFKAKFGEDGNLLVAAIQTDKLFELDFFKTYAQLHRNLKAVPGVDDVMSIPSAQNLEKETVTDGFEIVEKLKSNRVFPDSLSSQAELDSAAALFLRLPFYRGLIYNAGTRTYLMGIRINGAVLNSEKRDSTVRKVERLINGFGEQQKITTYSSGLPLIRNSVANRVAMEMRWLLAASLILSAIILFIFFRSVPTVLLSLATVVISVIWSFGIMHLFGYRITLLNALIPPLVVVIGIPNCIYFLNKYHTAYRENPDKKQALLVMLSRMGIVTLFCNLTAAIGFAVFALTRSALLREFGMVAGISIMAIFFISYIMIPGLLVYMHEPDKKHTRYLDNKLLARLLSWIERLVFEKRKQVYLVTGILLAVSIAGILRLKQVGFIVDDLPKTDKIYTDLKFIEQNFKGVMPLEITIDTRKRYGATRVFENLQKMDSLQSWLAAQPDMARPLSLTEGMKFAKQALFDGDSASYMMPGNEDLPFLAPYLKTKKNPNDTAAGSGNTLTKLVSSFVDTSSQVARISVSMADVGSRRLPVILDSCRKKADEIFSADKYTVRFTGASVTFLEGSRFIIAGLRDSVLWAFALIALCMLFLFRSFRILLCSLIPNIVPLVIIAGVMGWAGVPLKPSTILVFSVALGIAIDITIRFLINYRQELPLYNRDVATTVRKSIHHTGISIWYTAIVLVAGFIIFCFSSFGGTQALGWLTSLTLVVATLTNLILLPVLLMVTAGKKG